MIAATHHMMLLFYTHLLLLFLCIHSFFLILISFILKDVLLSLQDVDFMIVISFSFPNKNESSSHKPQQKESRTKHK